MTAWVGIPIIALLIVWCVLTTVLFLRALDKVIQNSDRMHEHMSDQLETALDRIMAANFNEFKAQQMTENAPVGGYIEPPEEEWAPVVPLPLDSS